MLNLLRLAFIAALFSTNSSVAAPRDILAPGTKGISHSYSFVGLDAFPEHRFLIAPQNFGGWQVLREGESVSWYKFSSVRVYAVSPDLEIPDQRSDPDLALLDGFPKSTMELKVESSLLEGSPADSRKTVYRVLSVDNAEVGLELVSDEYLDETGEAVNPFAIAALIPFLAGGGLILLIVIRRRRAS